MKRMHGSALTMRGPAGRVNLPIERTLRLTTGLILFSYAASHFLSHATGIFLLSTLESLGRGAILAPWRTGPARLLLLASVLIHGGLGLRALDRRRHLRMPALEAWQLGVGLTIPLLLLPHVTDVRIGYSLYGFEDSYSRILYLFWLVDPRNALPRQFLLLLVVWVHGCIGIHMWLRFRPWYRTWRRGFAILALAIPILAVIGIINAGWNEVMRARLEPGFSALNGPPPAGTPDGANLARLADIWHALAACYLLILAGVLLHRQWRDWRERRISGVAITYAGARTLTVPRGFSILEISRWFGIPHASACGGRGRCSTCRVRVVEGAAELDVPNAAEAGTLARVGAPQGVRLACQVRPRIPLTVVPLVPVRKGARRSLAIDLRAGRELTVTAMSVDLRDSTRLAAERLPFDAIFIVDQYVQAVTGAVRGHGGHVTSIAGDGLMSVFGLDGDPVSGARNALRAAEALWLALDSLSSDLSEQIAGGLRFGIGVQTGVSIVGTVGPSDAATIYFLGDTGNVAARLEGLTKDASVTMIVARATLNTANWDASHCPSYEAQIRGRTGDPVPARLVRTRQDLADIVVIAKAQPPRRAGVED